MFLKLKIFLVILSFSFVSHADIGFDFEGFFPNRVMNNLISAINGDYSAKNLEFDFEASELIEGLNVEKFLFDFNLEVQASLDQNGNLGGYFLLPTATLKAKNVDLIYITESDIGGVKVKVKTQLQCSVADLLIKEVGGFIRGSIFIEEGVFSFDKDNAEIELGDFTDAFSIDLKNCTGAQGLEPVVAAELTSWLESEEGKDQLLNVIVDQFISAINSRFEEFQDQGYLIPFVNKYLRLRIDEGKFKREGFSFKGMASFDHEEEMIYSVENSISNEVKKATFRLPSSFAHKILPFFIKESDKISLDFSRDQIPGVDLLFNNRLVQMFVWSDLLNFNKKSQFDLSIGLKPKQVALQKYRTDGLSYHLYSEHKSNMDFKNSKGKLFPYMDFNGKLSSSIDLNIDNKGFGLILNDFRINSNCEWDLDMLSWRKTKPGGKPWMSMILKQAKAGLNGTQFSWSWKDLGLKRFEFKSVELKKSKYSLDLEFDI